MRMSMDDGFEAESFVDRLTAAVRDNPLAAGLIGAGVAWMLLGGNKGLGKAAGLVSAAVVPGL